MAFEIREADFSDGVHAAGIVAVLDSYASDPVANGEPLRPEVRERLVAELSNHPTVLVLLAFSSQEPVGIAVCFFGLSTFEARPLLNVHDLAVIPAFRGQGVGRALLSEVEARARLRGCCKITLEVQENNAIARSLYRDFGFADVRLGDASSTRFLSKLLEPRSNA